MSTSNTSLRVTELDYFGIRENLKTFLKSQEKFSDYNFEGSGMAVLLDLLAYNTYYNSFYMNMIANEMFLDTAVLRSSVVSQAKSLGYTSRSAIAAQAIVNLTVNKQVTDPTTSLYVPRFTPFVSASLTGASYTFFTVEIGRAHV